MNSKPHWKKIRTERERKVVYLNQISEVLCIKFGDEINFFYWGDDLQQHSHSFQSGICGDDKHVDISSCGISTCKDCRVRDTCCVCDWLNNYYNKCHCLDENECHGEYYIAPNRNHERVYHYNNKHICSSCNSNLPKSKQKLGFSIELEEQRKQKQQALVKAQSERQRHFEEMSNEQKNQLKQEWIMSQIDLQTMCCKCRQYDFCESVSCQ